MTFKKQLFKILFSVLTAIFLPSLYSFNSVDRYMAAGENISLPGETENNIKGYSAGGATVYNVEFYWTKDMTFVYDRGKYNPSSGKIESTIPDTSENGGITSGQVEKEGSPGEINKWYGFDGLNNRVIVLNKSNADISAKFSSSSDPSYAGNDVALTLYDGKVQQTTINESTALPDSFNDDEDIINRFGNNTKLAADNKITLSGAPGNGSAEYKKVFLNVSGKPSDGLSDSESNASTIGTITVTISKNV